ncbi:hypothetical protein E4T38_07688 [Aureobasidium subglaciale]|nr:hypothetical protein E4T38_07688 [Aureobasidium subglaciale]KAI5216879.1 hypothetical protein E4T40_07698 [Aureobasidium subglaciale]KAI5220183.1 hypothetical protein E4T41_07613 [Aureobasidium subglaciale]KAI5258148.1 hypothetical protein E4T46_07589 [Aureobasidium subglaciale]
MPSRPSTDDSSPRTTTFVDRVWSVMNMHLFVRNTSLIALAVFGYVALWKFATDNGTFSLMRTGEKYATEFTQWRTLDIFLKSLLTLFWPMVNGTQPGSSLMCFYFAGQGIAAWILTAIEGQRRGHKDNSRLISFTAAYGLLFQALGIGIVGPVFFAFSPLGDRSTSAVLTRYTAEINAIIPATIGAIIIPTILMSLHAPTAISLEHKIDLIRLWQFFPLLFRLCQRVWSSFVLVRITSYRDEIAEKNPETQRRAFGRVYIVGLCCAAVPHISTVVASLTALLCPTFFATPTAFHPVNLFVPVSPFSGHQASTVGQGAHWFLQWDMTLMFSTYLIWAYFANIEVIYPASGVISSSLVLRIIAWSLLFGPMGAALLATWERDDFVLNALEHKIKSRKDLPAEVTSRIG